MTPLAAVSFGEGVTPPAVSLPATVSGELSLPNATTSKAEIMRVAAAAVCGSADGIAVSAAVCLGDARPQRVVADRGRTRAAAAARPRRPRPAHAPQTGHRFTRIRATAWPHPDTAGMSTRRRP